MTEIIHAKDAIKRELDKPWASRQADRYLSALLYWRRQGYEFTEEQAEQIGLLAQMIPNVNSIPKIDTLAQGND